MGFTTPRDWTVGETVTEDMMDEQVRDNIRYLKGLDGVPTIESGLTIDNTGGDERLLLPLLSTAECTTVLNAEGEVAFDEQTHQVKIYNGTAVKAVISEADVDDTPVNGATTVPVSSNWAYDHVAAADPHTGYVLESLFDAEGDLLIASGDDTPAKLAIGAAGTFLGSNGTTAAWTPTAPGEGHISIELMAYESIGQGTWVFSAGGTRYGVICRNDTTADADNISWNVFLAVGTYSLRVMFTKYTDKGIVDIDIDATEVLSFDGYNAGEVLNSVATATGIAIAVPGIKTLKARLDGKHGSSSDYVAYLQAIALWRTA